MALTDRQLQASIDANIDPVKQTAPIAEPVDNTKEIKEITKNVVDFERIDKQTTEAEREAFSLSAEIGFQKGLTNFVGFVDWATQGSPLVSWLDGDDDTMGKYKEANKVNVKELIAKRDAIYEQHSEDVSIGTQFASGAVEGLTNIPETAVGIGAAVITGGGSLVYQVGGQMATDLALSTYDTYKYYGRKPTALELLGTAALSGVTSIGPVKSANAIRNKFGAKVAKEITEGATEKLSKEIGEETMEQAINTKIDSNTSQIDNTYKNIMEDPDQKTVKVNIQNEQNIVADDLNGIDGSNKQAQADKLENRTVLKQEFDKWSDDEIINATAKRGEEDLILKTELAELTKVPEPEAIVEVQKKPKAKPIGKLSDKELQRFKEGKELDKDIVKKLRIEEAEATIKAENLAKQIEKEAEDKAKPKLTKKEIRVEKSLEKKTAKIEAKAEAKRVARIAEINKELAKPFKIKNTPKDFIQARVQKGEFIHRIAEKSVDTVKATSEAIHTGKGGVGFKPVEEAIKHENARFDIASDLAENTMRNELNSTPSEYISGMGKNSLGSDKTAIWINGKHEMISENMAPEEIKFWTNRVDDADLINGMGGKLHTYDITDAQGFKDRNIELYESGIDEVSLLTKSGKVNENVIKHISGDKLETDKRIVGQMILGDSDSKFRLNRLIEESTDSPAQFKTKYGVEPEKFSKSAKELLTMYAPDEGAFLRLNQAMNKQKFMVEYHEHFNVDFGEDLANVDLTNLVKEGELPALIGKINPMFKKGYFGDSMIDATNEQKSLKFYELLRGMADTRDNTRYTGRHRSFNSLKEIMGDANTTNDQQGQKLIQLFTHEQSQFLKNNSELVQHMFTNQANDVARITTYGSTSPHRILNQYRFTIKDVMTEKMGKTINQTEEQALKQVTELVENMFSNTQAVKPIVKKTGIARGSQFLRGTLGRGILNLTGAAELGASNYSNTLARAMHYNGGSKSFKGALLRPLKRLGMSTDLPNSKYYIAQTLKDNDFSKHTVLQRELGETKTGLKIRKANKFYDDVSYSIQKFSDRQAKKYGEGFTTMTFDQMPNKYEALNPNLKAHLKANGIGEDSFEDFAKYTKDHIRANGSMVNVDDLLKRRGTNMSGDVDLDEALISSYYTLSNNIGNPVADDILHNQVKSEWAEWSGMFRRYTRAMNTDAAKKMLYYSDAKGVQRNRFMGQRSQLKHDPVGLIADSGTGLAVASALAVGGLGYTVQKDLIYSNRRLDERLAIVQIKAGQIAEAFDFNDFSTEEITEFVGVFAQYAAQGVNPFDLEQLESSAPIVGVLKRAKKVYDTFTNEEKKTYGTNVEEGTKELAYLISSSLISNAVSKNVVAFNNIKDPQRVYGFSKEDNIKFASILRLSTKADVSNTIDITRNEAKATADYLEEKHDSYNSLPNMKKQHFNKVMDVMNVPEKEKEGLKTEYALYFGNVKKEDEATTVKEVYGLNHEEYVEYEKSNPIIKTKFDKMSAKKRAYFDDIIQYKGVTDPDEIQKLEEEFHARFKSIQRSQLSKELEEGFGINKEDFNDWYDDRN